MRAKHIFSPSSLCRKSPCSHDDQGPICCFLWKTLTNSDVNSCLKVLKHFGSYKVNEFVFRDKPEWEILKHMIMEWAAETISNRFPNWALRKLMICQDRSKKWRARADSADDGYMRIMFPLPNSQMNLKWIIIWLGKMVTVKIVLMTISIHYWQILLN